MVCQGEVDRENLAFYRRALRRAFSLDLGFLGRKWRSAGNFRSRAWWGLGSIRVSRSSFLHSRIPGTSSSSSPTGPGSNPPNTLNLTASGCIPTNGLCQTLWRLVLSSDKSVTKVTASVNASRTEKLELELDGLSLWRVGI